MLPAVPLDGSGWDSDEFCNSLDRIVRQPVTVVHQRCTHGLWQHPDMRGCATVYPAVEIQIGLVYICHTAFALCAAKFG